MSSWIRAPAWAPSQTLLPARDDAARAEHDRERGTAVVVVELGAVLAAHTHVVHEHRVPFGGLRAAARGDHGDDQLGRRLGRHLDRGHRHRHRGGRGRGRGVVDDGGGRRARRGGRGSVRSAVVAVEAVSSSSASTARGDDERREAIAATAAGGRIRATLPARASDLGVAVSRLDRRPTPSPCVASRAKRAGWATAASWPPSMRNASASGIDSNSLICRTSGTTSSFIVTTTAVGTSISPEPVVGTEPAERAAGLGDHPPVVARRLVGRPRLPRVDLALQVELTGEPTVGLGGSQPGGRGEPGEPEEREPLVAVDVEVSPRSRRARARSVDRRGGARGAGRPPRPSSSRGRRTGRARSRRPSRSRRRRSPRAGTGPAP